MNPSNYYPTLAEPYPETTENIDKLFYAVKTEDYSTIRILLRNKQVSSATVNYADITRPSLLIECCKRTDKKLLQLMITLEKQTLDCSYEDAKGHRATWYAIEHNFIVGIHDLLEYKLINPNLHDTKTSFTPLLQAIEKKSAEIVEELIRGGANPNLPPLNPNHHALSPLIYSIINGTDDISRCLINSLCNLNQYVEDGYTALHYSVLMSRHPTIRNLLKAGARTNVRTLFGVTPMTLAILCDDAYSVQILIEHGYAITRSYPWNEYPFEQAVRVHAEGAAMMIAYLGCELKIKQDNRSSNPFTMAAEEGLINLMFLLLNMQPQWINQHWIRKRQYPNALYRLKDARKQLQNMFSNPFRLKQLCRAQISQKLGKFFIEKLNDLKKTYRTLADTHWNYLRYNDLVDPTKHFRPIGKHLAHFEVNGIEFYWDQRTLRYRNRHEDKSNEKAKGQNRLQPPKSAILRLTSALIRRQEQQQQQQRIAAEKRNGIVSDKNSTESKSSVPKRKERINVKSANNAGRGIRSKRDI